MLETGICRALMIIREDFFLREPQGRDSVEPATD